MRVTTLDTLTDKAISELEALELEVLTGYTLADAMREGSRVTGQAVGTYHTTENACAFTAAFLGAKGRDYL